MAHSMSFIVINKFSPCFLLSQTIVPIFTEIKKKNPARLVSIWIGPLKKAEIKISKNQDIIPLETATRSGFLFIQNQEN